MISIGPYTLDSRVVLAPMAGVTDRPFRQLCRDFGAGLAASEMVTSDPTLRNSRKSLQRLNHEGEREPRSVQIAGSDPQMMAEAAQFNVENGAQIIDINMGCPAKKVCKRAAGSALLKDEVLVEQILNAVVNAVDVPVSLKIRTGWDREHRNGPTIARIAEQAGIQALAVHGRTRACKYEGHAEYDTIATIVEQISIPVFANGDIVSAEQAQHVLDHTGAAGVMLGRAAQGQPWIFRDIDHFLNHGELPEPLSAHEKQQIILQHIQELQAFYGDFLGVRIARKHVGWYLQHTPHPEQQQREEFRRAFNRLDHQAEQLSAIETFFSPSTQEVIAA